MYNIYLHWRMIYLVYEQVVVYLLNAPLCLWRLGFEVLEVVVEHSVGFFLIQRESTRPVKLLFWLAGNVLAYFSLSACAVPLM